MIQIVDKKKCCGCTACLQICSHSCISMEVDEEGFYYPVINKDNCVNCHLCEQVCPVLNRYEIKDKPLKCYLAKTKDELVRSKSSSGGLFSELAKFVINRNGVIFGVRFDENWNAVYDYSETEYGLDKFRGSKYVQADINSAYIQVQYFLKQGRFVLFSGTPCFVSGLNHFLHKEYENLITIDIVCHSIPSPKVWSKYLYETEKKYGKIVRNVSFRDKSNGWSNYSLRIGFGNTPEDHIIEKHEENLYMQGFLHDLFTRPSCSECPARNFTSGSDITLADAWGINKYHPELNDEKGLSHVLLNTKKGKELMEQLKPIIDNKVIDYYEVEPTAVHLPLTRSCSPHRYRKLFYEMVGEGNTVIDSINICIKKDAKRREREAFLKKYFFFKLIYRLFKRNK